MESTRWSRIQEIFHEALTLPVGKREEFLNSACADDYGVREEVRIMLAADSRKTSLLDRGLPDVAYRLVGNPAESIAPQEFGPYRLKKVLGEGGMGVVWLAERSDAGNLVAIKFLPHAGFTPARRERFAREIRTLAKLKHPYIARLYDAGSLADGTPWFVMEYVEGVRLTDFCRAPGRTIEEQLGAFRMVLEAVQYAHGQEIIHRDLKPSNILMAADGTPRLLDFGIARELHQMDDSDEQTRPGLRFFSPDYAAPEWAREGVLGLYTDVYSLGVILYEILTGRLPFEKPKGPTGNAAEGNTARRIGKPSDAARKQAAGEPNASAAVRLSKTGWSDLDVLCLKAMHQDPGQRYPSVEALLRDVDHFLRTEPLEARPDTLLYRTTKFVRRNRTAVLATAAALVLVACMATFFTVRLIQSRAEALAETARTERIERFMLNLFGAHDLEAAPATDMKAAALLDRGVEDAGSLRSDPATQADLYETLGAMYDRLGKFDQADKLFSIALDKSKTGFGPESAKTAELMVEIGALRGDQGRSKEAEKLVTEGADLVGRRLPANDPFQLFAKETLGRVLVQGGSYEKAIAILQPIVQSAAPTQEDAYPLREGVSDLAVAEQNSGHYQAAESLAQRAIAMDRQLLGERHPQTGFDLMNLGSAEVNLGENAEAEKNYRTGVDILKSWYGADHPDTATSMAILARTLMTERKDDEAEAILKQVLEIQERNYGKVHERIAFTLDSLGRIAVRRGNLADAQAEFSRALAIDQSLLGGQNYQTGAIESDLGDLYNKESKYALAEPVLRDSVTALGGFPAGHPLLVQAQARWGHSLVGLKRYSDAEKQLDTAIHFMEASRTPPAAQLQAARQDLVAVYQASNRPQDAKKLQAELTAASAPTVAQSGAH
jgi:eukaryotic-like serine/threonine-protein kinase